MTFNDEFPIENNFDLTTILGWRKTSESVLLDFGASNQTVFGVIRDQGFEQLSGEIRIASNFGGPVNFVAGAFYFQSEYSLKQAIQLDWQINDQFKCPPSDNLRQMSV